MDMLTAIRRLIKDQISKIGFFMGTDMNYVARQGSWLLSGQMVSNLASFFLVIAFGNLLPKETYGTYKFIFSVAGIFMLASLSDMSSAVIKGVAEGYENMYKKTILTEIKWGLLGSLGSLLTSGYYFYNDSSFLGYAFIVTAIFIPFFDTSNTYTYILGGKKRFDILARMNMVSRGSSALVLIATLFFTKNILFILIAYYLPYIFVGFIIGPIILRRLNLNDRFDQAIIDYGKHLSLLSAMSVGISFLDGIIVFHYLGAVQLAVFSIASAPSARLQSLFQVVPEIALPKLAERPIEELRNTLFVKLAKSIIFSAILTGIFILIIPLFFNIFLPKYNEAIPYAIILAIPLIWYPFSAIIPRTLSAKGAKRFLYESSIIASITQLIVMFGMIYYFGLIGAVMGRVTLSLLTTALAYSYFRRL